MSSTRSVLYFSLVLSILSLLALGYTLIYHGDFIAHNIIFNSAIALFDVVVLVYAVYTIIYVSKGMAQWENFKKHFPRDGEEPKLRGGMRLLCGRLQDLVSFDEGERTAAVSLISKALDWRVDFIFYAAGATISLGLLGTFFGLTFTMDGIRGSIDILSSSDQVDAKLLVTSLAAPLGGMATAFSSSMFGLASSICAGLLAHFMGRATDGWVYDVEKWSFVASGENAADMIGEDHVADATGRAVNRLAAVLSRHVNVAREDSMRLVDVAGGFVQGQIAQQQTLEKILKAFEQQSDVINKSVVTILDTVAGNSDALKRVLEVTQNGSEAVIRLTDASEANSAFIARATEAAERNSESVAQTVAQVSQVRVEFIGGLESLLQKLVQIEKNTLAIEHQTSRVVLNGNEQQAALEMAAQVLRAQQQAVMEGMRDLTEARVSIVSAVKAAQKAVADPYVKG